MLFKRIIYSLVLVLAIAATWFQLAFKKSTPLAHFNRVPDFSLTDANGNSVTLAGLKGKVWLADFFYASCPGPCPIVAHRLDMLQSEAFKDSGVRFVSISTQPEMDTPDVLQKYARKFHATPGQWLFLTGDKAQIFKLANHGFLLTAMNGNDAENPVIHSTQLALVDKSGNIRGYYDGTGADNSRQILNDIQRLLHE